MSSSEQGKPGACGCSGWEAEVQTALSRPFKMDIGTANLHPVRLNIRDRALELTEKDNLKPLSRREKSSSFRIVGEIFLSASRTLHSLISHESCVQPVFPAPQTIHLIVFPVVHPVTPSSPPVSSPPPAAYASTPETPKTKSPATSPDSASHSTRAPSRWHRPTRS